MRFFFVCLLVFTSAQKWDMDQSSLLQSKFAKGDDFAVFDEAVWRCPIEQPTMIHMSLLLRKSPKASAVALLKVPVTEQNALLRRAGQSHELTNIVRQYAALPVLRFSCGFAWLPYF